MNTHIIVIVIITLLITYLLDCMHISNDKYGLNQIILNYIYLSILKMTEINNVQYGTDKYKHKKKIKC